MVWCIIVYFYLFIYISIYISIYAYVAIQKVVDESQSRTTTIIEALQHQIQNEITQSLVTLNESLHTQWNEMELKIALLEANSTALLEVSTEMWTNSTALLADSTAFLLTTINTTANDTLIIFDNKLNLIK